MCGGDVGCTRPRSTRRSPTPVRLVSSRSDGRAARAGASRRGLHHRVVEGGAEPAHRAEQASGAQPVAKRPRGVWRTTIGVDDGLAEGRLTSPAGHLQRVHDELPTEVVGDRPADDSPGAHVEYRGTGDLAFARRGLGDIGEPESVRRVGDEAPSHQIAAQRESSPLAGSLLDGVGSACGIRTRDLRLERAASWATRRMRHAAMAGEGGFEPPHTDSESAVLPLDDSPPLRSSILSAESCVQP